MTTIWRADEHWTTERPVIRGRLAANRCRYMLGRQACGARAVAWLDRAMSGRRPIWYAYCEQHLYGRVIRDGLVGRLIEEDQP